MKLHVSFPFAFYFAVSVYFRLNYFEIRIANIFFFQKRNGGGDQNKMKIVLTVIAKINVDRNKK